MKIRATPSRLLNSIRTLGVLICAGLLCSCATLSETECHTADWESIGYKDGSYGYSESRFNKHIEACAAANIQPNREEYASGRERGLDVYCQARNGLRIGRQGGSYFGVCPPETESSFLHGFEVGKRLHEVELELNQLRRESRELEYRLRQEQIEERERSYLLARLREVERAYGRMQSELRHLEWEARRL